MALQIRRGTDAERQAIVPLQGELIFTTDTKKLFVGDGLSPGGVPITGNGASGTESLDQLVDVILTAPQTGQVLRFNGASWINAPEAAPATESLDQLIDVILTEPQTGEVLRFNGSSWINAPEATSNIELLDQLNDVVLTDLLPGQTLSFDGVNWVNTTNENPGAETLDQLSDVVLVEPQQGQLLKFDGVNWANSELSLSQLTNVGLTVPQAGQVLAFNGTNWINSNEVSITPTLSGPLNTNGFSITSPENNNINLAPGVGAKTVVVGPLQANTIVAQSGNLVLASATNQQVVIGSSSLNADGNLAVVRNTYSNEVGQGFVFSQHHENPQVVDFTFYRSRGTATAPAATLDGDRIADITFYGHDGSTAALGAAISALVEGTPQPGQIPTKLRFGTSDGVTGSPKAELSSTGVWKVNSITGLSSPLTLSEGVNVSKFLQLPPYADDAERDAALVAPVAGTVIFMQSGTAPAATNQIQYYNGTSWVSL